MRVLTTVEENHISGGQSIASYDEVKLDNYFVQLKSVVGHFWSPIKTLVDDAMFTSLRHAI